MPLGEETAATAPTARLLGEIVLRNFHRAIVVGMIALAALTPGQSIDGSRKIVKLKQHERTFGYTLQRVSVKAGCFPDGLNLVLAHIARKTGGRPIVTSGHRHGG